MLRIPFTASLLLVSVLGSAMAAPPSFRRDVRPILADHCFTCHGPDEQHRKGDLRLDERTAAQAAKREIIERILSDEPSLKMPPKSGRALTTAQVDVLKRWVDAGAPWEEHWAFVPLAPVVPPTSSGVDIRNPIDAFIAAERAKHQLTGSPEADRTTLIRRVTFDLTGLPPSPAEVDAFLQDAAPDAYERIVDRLLNSPRYGERMAWRWLEAARYADTSGYQSDGDREMWRWRDGVIEAFNRNQPFDQLITEQLAGDLIPNATLEQRIASGFNRNHRGNSEGGIVPEEYAVEYVVDRVDTTATVFMGLTMGCARCHDHKYDPISQREFYQLYAFFNNIPERGRALKLGNSPPLIPAPTAAQQQEWERLRMHGTRLADRVAGVSAVAPEHMRRWAESIPESADWQPTFALKSHFPLADSHFDGQRTFEDAKAGAFGFQDRFTLSAWVRTTHRDGPLLTRMIDDPEGEGYGVRLVNGRVQVFMTKRWLDDAMRIETVNRIPVDEWFHLAVRYDGSRATNGIRVFINGQPQDQRSLLDELNQTFATMQPFRVGAGGGAKFRGQIRDVRIYGDDLNDSMIEALAVPEPLGRIVRLAQPSAAQANKRQFAYLETAAPAEIRQAWVALQDHEQRVKAFRASIPSVMVMEELPTPRPAFILKRGQYDQPGERVQRDVPRALGAWPDGAPRNRLGLAQWLTSPSHPLTSRVAVNLAWQLHFGIGLVKTTEDFGVQGEPPSHPELLDYLAYRFIHSRWNLKELHRLIVTSATYRQSSRITPTLLAKDPDNRLLARGPRFRLSAEMLRDQALNVSGLLVEHLGGPSVKPYQPPGLWTELTSGSDYVRDRGASLYRRSLYTYWKRTIAPPGMMMFDAAGREAWTVRENRTNSPLQALTLLNDVGFVEAARAMAQQELRSPGSDDRRLTGMFRKVLGRSPSADELRILRTHLQAERTTYRNDPEAARRWVTIGDYPTLPNVDPVEIAAYGGVASLLLNLDETITRE